jgi:hypothetical protein
LKNECHEFLIYPITSSSRTIIKLSRLPKIYEWFTSSSAFFLSVYTISELKESKMNPGPEDHQQVDESV